MNVIVTHIDNIEKDEEGNFLLDEDGVPKMINEEDVGILLKTHVVQVTNMVDGMLQVGHSPLCEVLWNEKRSPAPDLVAPTDLAWLTVGNDEEDDSDEEEVDDDSYEGDETSEAQLV